MTFGANVYLERIYRQLIGLTGNDGIDGSVTSPSVAVDSNFSGQVTVAAAGTEVQGPNVANVSGFMLIAHPDNTDVCWAMDHGESKADGYPVSKTNPIILKVANLNECDFDADVSGEKICWIKI